MSSLRFLIMIVGGLLSALSSGSGYSQNAGPEGKLYGSWECEMESEQDGVKMSMEYDMTYARDGTADGSGTLWLKTGQLPEMEYSITSGSVWEVTDDYLIETATEIEAVNVSHPHLDRFFNLQSIIPEDASDSSEILLLDDSRLKTRSESYGTIVNCVRSQREG